MGLGWRPRPTGTDWSGRVATSCWSTGSSPTSVSTTLQQRRRPAYAFDLLSFLRFCEETLQTSPSSRRALSRLE
jgi:hypothetical protein